MLLSLHRDIGYGMTQDERWNTGGSLQCKAAGPSARLLVLGRAKRQSRAHD